MKSNSTLDAINSNFLKAKLIYPTDKLISYSRNYFEHRNYIVDSKGIESARISILNNYSLPLDQLNNILLTASTSESYLNILTNISDGGEILFPSPAYPLFEYISKYSKSNFAYYNLLDKYQNFDFKSLISKISKNTKAIVIITPNNPTGSIIKISELKKIEKICIDKKIKLIIDTVFDIFNFSDIPNITPNDIGGELEVFWLNGISKMFALPDLKLAWIYYQNPNETLLDNLETFNDTFLNANYLSQTILPDIFENSQNFQKKMIDRLTKNIEIVKQINSNFFKSSPPQGGIHFICSLISTNKFITTDIEFSDHLERYCQLLAHPLSFYEYTSEKPSVVMTILQTENNMNEIVNRINNFATEYLSQ